MAAATYATDLVDISTADSVTNWTAIGTGAIAVETDYFIQGAGCISKVGWTAATRGHIFNNAAGITIPTNGAIFTWQTYNNPNLMDTEANGGMQIIVGSGTAAYRHWYVRGSDTHQYGGWGCYVCNPDAVTPDLTTGSPTATKQYIGGLAKILGSGSLKGSPYGIDAMRYGRGELRLTGGDLANGYATFAAAATYGNDITRRWGLLYERDGAYFHQGLLVMGLAATAVDMRDTNRAVYIQNTKKVSAAFNGYEVRNAASRVEWSAVNITSLGTVSRGTFTAVDNATILKTNCVFTDMSTFVYQGNTVATGCTYRRTGQITQGGATITNCIFDSCRDTTTLLMNSPGAVTNSSFTSDGSNHALEYVQTGTGGTYNFTLTNLTFTGYAASDGSTGNEMIYVNVPSGNTVNITLSGFSSISVRTAGATVNKITGQCSLTISGSVSLVGAEVRVYDYNNVPAGTYGTELDGVESAPSSTFTYSGVQGNQVLIQIMKTGYAEFVQLYTLPATTTASFTASLVKELNA